MFMQNLIKLRGYSGVKRVGKDHKDYSEQYDKAKRPIEKNWTDSEQQYEVFSNDIHEHMNAGGWVGWVVQPGYIVYDIDSNDHGQRVLAALTKANLTYVAIKTPYGYQFVFKYSDEENQVVGGLNNLGIQYDTRNPNKGYIVCPTETTEGRDFINAVTLNDSLDAAPIWMKCQYNRQKKQIKAYIERWDMPFTIGERDELMNSYVGRLGGLGHLNLDEKKEIIRIACEFFCEPAYVDGIEKFTNSKYLQEEYNQKPARVVDTSFFNERGHFQHDAFCELLIQDFNFVRIHGQVHALNPETNLYTNDESQLFGIMLGQYSKITVGQKRNIDAYLNARAPKVPEADARYIALNNGVYDYKSETLLSYDDAFDMGLYLTQKIPVNYNPNVYDPHVDKMIEDVTCGDKQIRAVIEEMFGLSLLREIIIQKAFVLVGDGANGKSFLMDYFQDVIGEDNSTSYSLEDLQKETNIYNLQGKLLNVGPDISAETIKDPSKFKVIVGGDKTSARGLYNRRSDQFKPYATMVFTANEVPRMRDRSKGVSRRLVIVPFLADFTNKPRLDPRLIRTSQAKEYGLKLALDGLKRIVSRPIPDITESFKVMAQHEEWVNENNVELQFLNEYYPDPADLDGLPCINLYKEYLHWAEENAIRHTVSNTSMTRLTKAAYKLTTKQRKINGKNLRVYAKDYLAQDPGESSTNNVLQFKADSDDMSEDVLGSIGDF